MEPSNVKDVTNVNRGRHTAVVNSGTKMDYLRAFVKLFQMFVYIQKAARINYWR